VRSQRRWRDYLRGVRVSFPNPLRQQTLNIGSAFVKNGLS